MNGCSSACSTLNVEPKTTTPPTSSSDGLGSPASRAFQTAGVAPAASTAAGATPNVSDASHLTNRIFVTRPSVSGPPARIGPVAPGGMLWHTSCAGGWTRRPKGAPMTGKAMRLKRVIDPAGVSVICALDHGMTSPTFLEPLADIAARAAEAVAGGANVIMLSKGMIGRAEPAFSPTTSLALLLSASANPAEAQPQVVQIAQVEEALRLGADAVVLFTALGGPTEAGMIGILAGVGREGAALGMPLIAEAGFPTTYALGEELKEQYGFEYLRRNVRLCSELGADIGCSVGRNIFMHRSPAAITRALSRVIRERWRADDAVKELGAERAEEAS